MKTNYVQLQLQPQIRSYSRIYDLPIDYQTVLFMYYISYLFQKIKSPYSQMDTVAY